MIGLDACWHIVKKMYVSMLSFSEKFSVSFAYFTVYFLFPYFLAAASQVWTCQICSVKLKASTAAAG